jgi:hypothetical protein
MLTRISLAREAWQGLRSGGVCCLRRIVRPDLLNVDADLEGVRQEDSFQRDEASLPFAKAAARLDN